MEQEDRDMLISIHTKVESIEKAFDKNPYAWVVGTVKAHSKIAWVLFTMSLAAVFKSFSGN